MRKTKHAFTLAEMLVAVAILTLLILLVARLVNSVAAVTTWGSKRIDVSSEIRPLFNRMAVDFAQMIKRSDVSYYVKISSNPEAGNDLIAFFSLVDGFYPNTTIDAEVRQPQTTVISYRINSKYQLERMAKSLPFAGQSSPTPTPSLVFGPMTGYTLWSQFPAATSSTSTDADYNVVGADVFRFEYYYLLKTGAVSTSPWTSMTQVQMTDVAAIAVAIAVIDPRSRTLLSSGDITTLAESMNDYATPMATNGLLAQWQSVLDSSTLPRPALAGIRLYQRIFPL